MSLPTQYQTYIHLSRYARWNNRARRREHWPESVGRYLSFFERHLPARTGYTLSAQEASEFFTAIHDLDVMPSMRALRMAGPALERDEAAGYNCWFRAVDEPKAFDELMYVLLCGGGCGFSVERQYVGRLPMVPTRLAYAPDETIVVEDSRLGWCKAYRRFLDRLYKGQVPQWDVSKVRPEGAILKTTGGRASGPAPLVDLFKFTVNLFMNARGRRLNSIECHDLVCKIGEIVVVGGVRRAALLSLSNPSDLRMRDAKSGDWFRLYPHRSLANNSAAYTERPEVGAFMRDWLALYESKSGERGIFNRAGALERIRKTGRRVTWDDELDDFIGFGTNPCGEIYLRNAQACNLSEAVARPDDTVEDLARKVRIAAALGTWQATLTKFRWLGPRWRKNCEEERLLGVSLTGIMDNPLLAGLQGKAALAEALAYLREQAIVTNREWAARLGINPAAAVTCVKPSGTVSQLVDAASGIHPRYARRYIRRTIMDNKDPMTEFMVNEGFPFEPYYLKPEHAVVFEFPMRSPEEAVVGDERSAREQLEHWQIFQKHWCDHNASTTITVREHEWPAVGAWVWDNFDELGGLSFMPQAETSSYRQLPYESVDEDRLLELEARMPREVDWSQLAEYEAEDYTTSGRELACAGGACAL